MPTRSIRQVGVLVARELRALRRDRVALSLIIVAPILVAAIASVALGAQRPVDTKLLIVAPKQIQEYVQNEVKDFGGPNLGVRVLTSEDEARTLIEQGKASGAVAIRLQPTNPPKVHVNMITNRGEPIPEAIATDVSRLANLSAEFLPAIVDQKNIAVHKPVVERRVEKPLDGAELYGPVAAIFFLFLTTGFVARSLHSERINGTLSRLRVMGVRSGAMLASKGLTIALTGAIELVAVLVAMSLIFGAGWGSILATAMVSAAIILAVGSIALVIATVTRTLEQAQGVEIVIALVLAALGGNLVPLPNLPDAARVIAGFTPNGLAIHALRDVSAGAGAADVLAPTGAILAFAFVLGVFAFARARRIVAR